MSITFSPYSYPFVPSSLSGRSYWFGREKFNPIHDAHVQAFYLSIPPRYRVYSKSMQRLLAFDQQKTTKISLSDSDYKYLMDSYTKYGIKAAGRILGLYE